MSRRLLHALRHGDHLHALEIELQRAGIEAWQIAPGGKHPMLVFEHGGVKRRFPVPTSPRPRSRSKRNIVASLRRMLRAEAPLTARPRAVET